MLKEKKTGILLDLIQKGKPMTLKQQLSLTVQLSVPAIIAQLSFIIMQYIDAAMVGSLGAESSASIGLVSTTTWLFWGLCVAAATLVPCLMNFISIWAVRLTLAAWLAPTLGLKGVWLAMCIELCFRGLIFLVWLKRERWLKHIKM